MGVFVSDVDKDERHEAAGCDYLGAGASRCSGAKVQSALIFIALTGTDARIVRNYR
jgi:hypothetical protein